MEIREQQLVLLDEVVLLRDGFLHLHDHLGDAVDVFDGGQHLRTRCNVFTVFKSAADPGVDLYINRMTVFTQFGNTRWREGYAVLVVFNLFGNTNDHDDMAILFVGNKK